MEYPHHDPEWLTEKYWGERLSLNEMADEAGYSLRAVSRQMEKHDIPRRGNSEGQMARNQRRPVPLLQDGQGHEMWKDGTGQREGWTEHRVAVHRLAAVAWGVLDGYEDERQVHHRNEVPWDNREGNLVALSEGDHLGEHSPFRQA
jgi:hypothetical protein